MLHRAAQEPVPPVETAGWGGLNLGVRLQCRVWESQPLSRLSHCLSSLDRGELGDHGKVKQSFKHERGSISTAFRCSFCCWGEPVHNGRIPSLFRHCQALIHIFFSRHSGNNDKNFLFLKSQLAPHYARL